MSDDDKERTVNFGCGVWILAGLILSSLWGIETELRHIDHSLVMANCLASAAHGVMCPEAKR